jgi:hypothetical protein
MFKIKVKSGTRGSAQEYKTKTDEQKSQLKYGASLLKLPDIQTYI